MVALIAEKPSFEAVSRVRANSALPTPDLCRDRLAKVAISTHPAGMLPYVLSD